jgi:hypothetical protein
MQFIVYEIINNLMNYKICLCFLVENIMYLLKFKVKLILDRYINFKLFNQAQYV